jgi:predicted outer membrane repeat protein
LSYYTSVVIDGLYVSDWNIGKVSWIIVIGSKGIISNLIPKNSLILKNLEMSNIVLDEGTKMINTGTIRSLAIDNASFKNISKSYQYDESSQILYISILNWDANLNTSITNISIDNVDANFISIGNTINTPSSQVSITIDSLSFTNTDFTTVRSLIQTGGIEVEDYLSISFKNLIFSDLSFKNRGNLMYFEHQISSSLSISNLTVTDVISGWILIESLNKQNTELLTKVLISNSKFDSINDKFTSLIILKEGARLEVTNSSFTNIFAYEEGAIFFAEVQNTVTDVYDSYFFNNAALEGAILYAESGSVIRFHTCNISNNFGIFSGIAKISSDGFLEFYNSEIHNNYAASSLIAEIVGSGVTSIIDNWNIYENESLLVSEIFNEFNNTWSKLWFVANVFKEYYLNKSSTFDIIESPHLLLVISSSIEIRNNTIIEDQESILDLFLSEIDISDSIIQNLEFSQAVLRITSSTMTIENLSIQNISDTNESEFIYSNLDSIVSIKSTNFSDSTSTFIVSLNSQATLEHLLLKNIENESAVIKILNSDSLQIHNLSAVNLTISESILIYISASSNIILSDFSISDIDETLVYIYNSMVTSISEFSISGWHKPIYIKQSAVQLISNSEFIQNGDIEQLNGGSIEMMNSIATITNCSFLENKAISGGSISFRCTSNVKWGLTVNDTSFESNRAIEKGGAIYYDFARPSMNNLTFANNEALYGKNIASYPVKIRIYESRIDTMEIDNVASGLVYAETLYLSLVDYDSQVMVLDSESIIQINPVNFSESSLEGTNFGLLREGVTSFSNLIFSNKPGAVDKLFIATTSAIDSDKITTVFGEQISQNIISVSFRWCKPGEIKLDTGKWSECSAGAYSLKWNSTVWEGCISDAVCLGGTEIYINNEYWRRSYNSTFVRQWLNPKACKGGYVADSEYPTQCSTGYEGNLCTIWTVNKTVKYQRSGEYECLKWPNPTVNAIRVIGVALLVFSFIFGIIILNIRKRKDSNVSILMRILTNYLQLLASALSFELKFPNLLTDMFRPIKAFGSSDQSFLSFDWFVSDAEIKGPFPSDSFFKLFLVSILPIILFLIVAVIWLIAKIIVRKWVSELKRNLVISFITIVFMLHPNLTQNSLSIFQCVDIDDDIAKVRIYTEMEWYSNEHLFWWFVIGCPILFFWVIFIPIFGFVLLWTNIHKEKDNKIKQYFLILYQGFNQKTYYWEFINTLRKVLIFMVLVVLISYDPLYKVLVAVIILLVTTRVQIWLKPYKEKQHNEIELFGIYAGMFTLFTGIIFSREETTIGWVNLWLFIGIVVINVAFILKWIYLFVEWMSDRYKIFLRLLKILNVIMWKSKY